MKNILYALFAVAALVMVGCTKDQTYTPGEDLAGEQIYIDNSKSTFYVQTAAEKEEDAKELKRLSKGLQKDAVYADDTHVDVKIVRKGSNLGEFGFEVKLSMSADDAALFTLPAGSTQSGADQAAETVIYTVPCSFEAEASETVLRVGFDIAKLGTNVEYAFAAELVDLENSSNYGADSFEFVITHNVPVELPFVDVGTVTFHEEFWYVTPVYSDILIQVHKDDKKALDEGKTLTHVRFFIPRLMYQICAASVAAGDGFATEDDMEYFAQGDGIMIALTPKYEIFYDYTNLTYPHPVFPDKYKAQYPMSPMSGISPNGEMSFATVGGAPTAMVNLPAYSSNYASDIYAFWAPGNSAEPYRVMNTYTYPMYYYMFGIGGWPDSPMSFTWDKNTLEDDWANYFKVDYNNDVNYNAVGEGIFTSEYQGNFATKTLYKGVEAISGNTVYYVDDAYGTTTEETGYLGLALSWNGSVAKVVDNQPLNIQWNGRELYASQSQKVKSAIAFNEKGNITKITFGVAIVNEEGQVLGDYTETFDIEAPETGLEPFLGEFTQYTYELYGPFDSANQVQSLKQAFYPLSSTVTIEQATDKAGNPIANKVKIYGLIPTDYDFSATAGGYLEGTYDPSTNTIDVPAQFFHDMEWDGSQIVGAAIAIYPYFQPGLTNYNVYDFQSGPCWLSELGSTADSMAIHFKNGMLEFGSSTNDPAQADGYSIILGYYDADYDEFVVDVENMTLFTTISWPSIGVPNPTLIPAQAGGGAMPLAQPKFVKKSGSINAKASFEARKVRGEKLEVANLPVKK